MRDRDLLLQCLKRMGYSVRERTEVRGFQGTRAVEFSVEMPHGYNIGFARGAEGFYDIVADWWGVRGVSGAEFAGRLEGQLAQIQDEMRREFEEMQRRIRREYALNATLAQLKQEGFEVVEQTTATDGTVKILARRTGG